jgi:hypothetical protein
MPLVPLFTKAELQAAFTQILPPGPAAAAATDWWGMFAAEVDADGRFLYNHDPTSPTLRPTNALAVAGPPVSPAEQERRERRFWGGMSIEERREFLLRFSNFHMRLVGLLTEELFERMRLAEGLSPESAERGRTQMRRIVTAIQAG